MFLVGLVKKAFRVFKHPYLARNRLLVEMAKHGFLHKLPWTPMPALVFLVPTMRCNLDCITCGIRHNMKLPERRPPGTQFEAEMPWDEWKIIIDQIGQFHPGVLISGGEPLMSENTIPIIRRLVHKHGLYVNLGTNGLLLGQYARELAVSGINRLFISVDGFGAV